MRATSNLIVLGLLMAAGITQPAGAGGTLLFEDHTHADAGGDGSYSLADYKAKVDANLWKAADNVTPAIEKLGNKYLLHVALQNGDGSGSAPTTWKDSNVAFEFDSGKTYSVSATGRTNRRTEFGVLVEVPGGKPSGRSGVDGLFGAATTITGQIGFYGSKLRCSTGIFAITPALIGLPSEIICCILESAGAFALGTTAGEIQRIYNVDLISNATASLLNTFNCPDAERMTLAGYNAALQRIVSTGSSLAVRDLILIGDPTISNYRATGGSHDLVRQVWTDSAPQLDIISADVRDWTDYDAEILDGATLARLAGIPIAVLDKDGVVVLQTITNGLGQLDYGSGIFEKVLKVRTALAGGGGAWTEHGPFTRRVNDPRDGTPNPNYPATERRIVWPRRAGTFGDQLQPLSEVIHLDPPAGTSDSPYFAQPELQNILGDVGQDVSVAGVTTKGKLQRHAVPVLDGAGTEILATEEIVTIETGTLPALTVGVPLSVDGTTYRVAEIRQRQHGGITDVLLARE